MRSGPHQHSTTRSLKILLVEDSEEDALLFRYQLSKAPWSCFIERVDTASGVSRALAHETWDLVVCDYSLPQFSALEAIALVRECGLDVPFIILSGTVGEEAAAQAMRAGAHDVVLKGNAARLIPAIERELAEARIRQELRASQAALARSEKLSAVGQMAAGIAHDLINILNPLSLYLHAIERGAKDESALRKSISEMRATVELGLEVVQRLRAFTRGQQAAVAMLELDRLVHDAVQLARPRATALKKAVRIHERLGGGPPVCVCADEIVAAVVNLIVNAIEAIPPGGNVWVTTGPATGGGAMVEVCDDGPGIPEDVAERVFEAFFTTKGDEGTGLGLAMVHATAKRYSGSVTLRPNQGKGGSCFMMMLPERATTAAHADGLRDSATYDSRREEPQPA